MPPRGSRASVDELREAARARVEETSLRVAAQEIGLSHTGLKTFLAGTAPYGPTLSKLRAWYARQIGDDPWFLVARLPEPQRSEAEKDLRRVMNEWRVRWGL